MNKLIQRIDVLLSDFMGLADGMRLEEASLFKSIKPFSAKEVSHALTKLGHRHAIVGAHAVIHHTEEPRSTADVDVVSENPEHAAHHLASLRRGASVRQHGGIKVWRVEAPHPTKPGKMVELADVASPDATRFHGVLDGAEKTHSGIPVASAEHLAAMKYLAYRSKRKSGTVSKWMSDRLDLQNLATAKKLDPVKTARHIVKMMKTGDDWKLPHDWVHDHTEFTKNGKDFPEP